MTIDDAVGELEGHETNTRFQRLVAICKAFFGTPRIEGSHHIFKTPWPGDPRINLQSGKGKAKPYQVRQVIKALQRLKDEGG
ncbi:MAG TPA: toxin HicA [Blastocatellia bacterium]|nr:toxin HicA [Blastocatellia bacterium]